MLGAALVALLGGCAGGPSLADLAARDAVPEALPVCHGHGCKLRSDVRLSQTQWQSVAALFAVPPETPAEERLRIALAVGRIERIVGPNTGTSGDGGRNTLFASAGQLDCIDETANTMTYIGLMERRGLLRWHALASPLRRGWPVDTWAHNTATVAERPGGAVYAIDSWFYDNGRPAAVVPAEEWLDGWSPSDADEAEADRLAAADMAQLSPAPDARAQAGEE